MYDLTIIGGGPAGVSAGVYAARKRLKTLFITQEFGGQSSVSEDIQNWIGFPHISGLDLAKSLETHLETYKADIVDIHKGETVAKIEKKNGGFLVTEGNGKQFETKTVLVATGSQRRKLDVPGATEFEHKGITYCASCDGPLFAGQDVAVIGGGNAGFETTAQLAAYTNTVYLLNRTDTFRADEVTVKRISENPKVKIIMNAIPSKIEGDKFVKKLYYKDAKTGEEKVLDIGGVFVEIGLVPATDYVAGLVDLNSYKQVVVNAKNQQTSTPGVWAAGDCTDGIYHQNNIASGDAVKALEDIYQYLHAR
jgi:alkyl hydroperoxide reductase subunit F